LRAKPAHFSGHLPFARHVPTTNTKGKHEPFTESDARAKVVSAYSYNKRDPWSSITPYSPGQDHSSSNGNGSKPPESNSNGIIRAKTIPLKTIEHFMTEMQYGDGKLFHACFDGQVVYDHLEKEWYIWNGKHWKRDANGFVKVLISGHLGLVKK